MEHGKVVQGLKRNCDGSEEPDSKRLKIITEHPNTSPMSIPMEEDSSIPMNSAEGNKNESFNFEDSKIQDSDMECEFHEKPKPPMDQNDETSTCQICETWFPSEDRLTEHNEQIHGVIKKYRCNQCNFESHIIYDILHHLRQVHGASLY